MKHTYDIVGMHCTSCAMNLEDALLDVPGVTEADASFKSAKLTVEHDGSVSSDDVRKAVAEAGYQVA